MRFVILASIALAFSGCSTESLMNFSKGMKDVSNQQSSTYNCSTFNSGLTYNCNN